MNHEWAVGMEVHVTGGYGIGRIAKVKSLGKLHVVLEDDSKWRVSTGSKVGDVGMWNRLYIEPARQKHKDAIERDGVLSMLNRKAALLSLECLREVAAVIAKHKQAASES